MEHEIIRVSEPTLLDQLPYGTACRVIQTGGTIFELWVQMNHDDSKPNWTFVGTFNNVTTDQQIKDEINNTLGRL